MARTGSGDRPPTLEEWRSIDEQPPPPPSGGSRLTERYEAPEVTLEELVADLLAPWRRLAACRGMDTDLWYPERGQSIEPATTVCGRCPVRDECLATALHHRETLGIWGGTSALARKRLARDARSAA